MQEEIANKWRKLNPKVKAIYGSALEGSSGQRLAINDIGFNPDTSSIELHDNVFGINAVEFGRVMGLKNTGEDVELDSPIEDEKVKQLVKSFCGNGKRVLVRGLAEQLEMCENVDEDFKV
ncbi:unnamed protein product [Prunus armeniaca]